jgi:ComF family protein
MALDAKLDVGATPGGGAIPEALRSVAARLLDILLPPVCILCRKRTIGHGLLCGGCWGRIEFISSPLCARLGVPLPYDTGAPGEPALSASAIANPPIYDRARAVARYSGGMRDLIHAFKYGDRHEGVPLFGRWLAVAGSDLLADAELILPVPLYRSRLWARRFNQAAVLANAVGALTHIPVDCFLLARVKPTPSQIGLSPKERRRNMSGAFRVTGDRKALRGKRVALIDDVITTGATSDACARVLKRAGAARVDVLTLARAMEAPGLPL